MPGFISLESVLVANTSQTISFPNDFQSLAYINDDPSATHRLVTNGQTISVLAGQSLELTGINGYESVVIGGNAGSTGAFRCVASPLAQPPQFKQAAGGTVVTANLADDSVTGAKLAPEGTEPSALQVINHTIATGAGGTTSTAAMPYDVRVLRVDVRLDSAPGDVGDTLTVENGGSTNAITNAIAVGGGVDTDVLSAGKLDNAEVVVAAGDTIDFTTAQGGVPAVGDLFVTVYLSKV